MSKSIGVCRMQAACRRIGSEKSAQVKSKARVCHPFMISKVARPSATSAETKQMYGCLRS
eukprot:4660996-Pleurochrysis_carterae.AAC.3